MFRKIFLAILLSLTLAQGALAHAAPSQPVVGPKGSVYLAVMAGAQYQQAWDIVPIETWTSLIGRYCGRGVAQDEDDARRQASDHGAEWLVAFYGYEETGTGGGGSWSIAGAYGGGDRQGIRVKVHLLVQEVATGQVAFATYGPRRATGLTTWWSGNAGFGQYWGSAYSWGGCRSDAIEAAAGKLPLLRLPSRGPQPVAAAGTPDVPVGPRAPELHSGPVPGTPITLIRRAGWEWIVEGPADMDLHDLWFGIPKGYPESWITWCCQHWDIVEGDRGRLVLTNSPQRTWELLVDLKWKGVVVGVFRMEPRPPAATGSPGR